MTRAEYMEKLGEKLEQFNKGLQKEIIEDYEQHFDEGLAAGRTEEEIIDELGSIEDMVQEFSKEDYLQMPAVCDGGQRCTGGAESAGELCGGQLCGADTADAVDGQGYVGDCEAIVLENVCADVEVRRSDDDRLHVQYYCNSDKRYQFYQYEKEQTLYVGLRLRQTDNLKSFLAFGRTIFSVPRSGRTGSFEISIPEHFADVQICSASGDVELDGVSAEKLTLSAASGDYEILHCKAAQLVLQTASGDVEITDTAAENGTIRTASGDVSVNHLRGGRLTIGTASGDVELCAGIKTCSVGTGSGDVEARLEGADSVKIGTGSGDVELILTGTDGVDLNASSTSGQLEVSGHGHGESGRGHRRLVNGDGSCKAEVSTGSGDVNISCP